MATVYVNDKPVDIGNERLNCIQAAEKAGVLIPSYCYHPRSRWLQVVGCVWLKSASSKTARS